MMRLTWVEHDGPRRRLRVEGPLRDEWNEVLERECAAVPAGGGALVLDLSAMTHVDRRGLELLQRLSAAGVRIEGENPLIAEVRRSGGWR